MYEAMHADITELSLVLVIRYEIYLLFYQIGEGQDIREG